MPKNRLLSFIGITFVMIVWGLSFLSTKVVVDILAPMTLAFVRFVIASVILYIILKIREPKSRLLKKDIPLMSFSGIIGISIYFFLENYGVKLTTASTTSIIVGSIPMLTVLSDYLFFGNKITLAKGIGVVLSFMGVYLIVSVSGQLSLQSSHFIGNLMTFGAAISWVIYSLATRPLNERYSRLAITTYQSLFGTLAIFPFVFLENNRWDLVDGMVVGNVLFLSILCSAVAYYLYVYALKELGVAVSSLFINLIPVVTVVGSYFILGENITLIQIIGGAIVVLSVYLADLGSWLSKKFQNRPAEVSKGAIK